METRKPQLTQVANFNQIPRLNWSGLQNSRFFWRNITKAASREFWRRCDHRMCGQELYIQDFIIMVPCHGWTPTTLPACPVSLHVCMFCWLPSYIDIDIYSGIIYSIYTLGPVHTNQANQAIHTCWPTNRICQAVFRLACHNQFSRLICVSSEKYRVLAFPFHRVRARLTYWLT